VVSSREEGAGSRAAGGGARSSYSDVCWLPAASGLHRKGQLALFWVAPHICCRCGGDVGAQLFAAQCAADRALPSAPLRCHGYVWASNAASSSTRGDDGSTAEAQQHSPSARSAEVVEVAPEAPPTHPASRLAPLPVSKIIRCPQHTGA
jgi:hypothetical protein